MDLAVRWVVAVWWGIVWRVLCIELCIELLRCGAGYSGVSLPLALHCPFRLVVSVLRVICCRRLCSYVWCGSAWCL